MGETLTSLFSFFLIRCNYLRPWLSSNRLKLQRKVTKTNYPDFFLISAINTREKQQIYRNSVKNK